MAAKKKKPTMKKTVKKAVKKVIKSKKTAQQSAVKSTKKAIKKPAAKSAKKTIKKTVLVKKIALKSQPPKKVAAKKTAVKNVALKQPAKIVKAALEKAAIPKAASVMKTAAPRKIEKTVTKKETVKETSKLMPRMGAYSATEEIDFVEGGMTPSTKATTLLGALEFTPYQPSEGEAYMNEQQRVHFRKILNAWKQQLMQDVDTTVGHLKEEAVFYADPVDRASQEEGFNLELRTRDRERRLIKKIEQSLDLINSGEYGFCEDCGADIGIRRLEARPTAVKCIDCKTFQEIREKQMGG